MGDQEGGGWGALTSQNGTPPNPSVRRYVTIAVATVLFIAIMFGFSPRSQWPLTAAMTVLAVALFTALLTPPIRRAALRRRRTFFWAGIAIAALGVGATAISLAYSSVIPVDLGAGATVSLLLVGMMVAWLPYGSKSVERAQQVQEKLRTDRPVAAGTFDPVAGAIEALRAPFDRMGPFVRVVGPWLTVFCALPLALILLGQTAKPQGISQAQAVEILLVFLALIIVGFLVLILAAIQWTRFMATGREPSWTSIPGRALWGWAWRLFIFGSVFRFADQIEPWLGQHLPGVEPWALHGLSNAVLLALTTLTAPFALHLTAVALGEPGRAVEVRAGIFRAAGRKLHAGAALVLAPYFLVAWLSDTFGGQVKGDIAEWTVTYVGLVMLFLTVLAFAAYLASLYARTEGHGKAGS